MSIESSPYYNYYTVRGRKFPTRLYAKLASRRLEDEYPIDWHLPNFDLEINKINLLEEPTESLNSLYVKRARDLRDSYDYLVLLYSGGHDSHNILETFMLNGIFIDEIIILDQFDRSFRKTLEDKNFEFLHQNAYEAELCAIPLAKYFIDTYSPKTKLTVVENSFGIHAKYWADLTERDMVDNLKSSGTLGIIGKTQIRTKDLSYYNLSLKKIKENKRVAHIWGRDKIILRYDNIGYFFTFVDGNIIDFIDVYQTVTKDSLPNEIEFFYTHPSMIKTMVKQAHMLINSLPFWKLTLKNVTRKYEDTLSSVIYSRKINAPYLGLKSGDFTDWTKYLDKRRGKNADLNLFNMCELALFKRIDSKISGNFQKQITIIGDTLKIPNKLIEDYIASVYSTQKYYIKYFE